MSIDVVRVELRLKKTFAIAKGSANVKTNLLAILDGRYCGEAAGSVAYGPLAEQMEHDINQAIAELRGLSAVKFEDIQVIDSLPVIPAAKAAVMEMVVNALSGKMRKPAWELFGLKRPGEIRTTVTFALDNPSETGNQIAESPFPIVKIKMGNVQDAELIGLLSSIRGKEMRVDANGGWSLEQAEEMIARLSRIGVKVIEQPTTPELVANWPRLKAGQNDVELFMDEGMGTHQDFSKYGQYCDGINIKMAKCGGIVEGIRLARLARESGKRVMLGCMVESSVGIAQAAYMSTLADYFDLDGPLLLERDIANGISYNAEKLTLDHDLIGGPELIQNVATKQKTL